MSKPMVLQFDYRLINILLLFQILSTKEINLMSMIILLAGDRTKFWVNVCYLCRRRFLNIYHCIHLFSALLTFTNAFLILHVTPLVLSFILHSGSFDKVMFWLLKEQKENLIYGKTMSLLPNTYHNNPVTLFPVM